MMNKRSIVFVQFLVLAVLLITACNLNAVRGSGDVITETREVSNFDRIDLAGSGDVVVIQSGDESLTIETDDNLMEYIVAEVRNGTLMLGFEPGFNLISSTRLIFTVGVDDLAGVSVSGSGNVEAENIDTGRLTTTISGSGNLSIDTLNADAVTANISGSGEITLAGVATTQDITISGSGNYRAGDLQSSSAEVNVNGSGTATVWASESLSANISGSGTVSYYGQPAVSSSGGGSGEVIGLGEK
jgi:predicted small secreted protein